jgi:hypothetical protein
MTSYMRLIRMNIFTLIVLGLAVIRSWTRLLKDDVNRWQDQFAITLVSILTTIAYVHICILLVK